MIMVNITYQNLKNNYWQQKIYVIAVLSLNQKFVSLNKL